MRLFCDIDGFTDNWVEVSDTWTRREVRDYYSKSTLAHEVGWWNKKFMACHLIDAEGVLFDDPKALTADALEDMDERLCGFVSGLIGNTIARLRNLGNASTRPSSDMNEQEKAKS